MEKRKKYGEKKKRKEKYSTKNMKKTNNNGAFIKLDFIRAKSVLTYIPML